MSATEKTDNQWQVYVILTVRQRLYTGITTDMERRWQQHRNGKGAKFFRGDKPLKLLFLENGHDRASATRREISIKQLSRPEKFAFIQCQRDNLASALTKALSGG